MMFANKCISINIIQYITMLLLDEYFMSKYVMLIVLSILLLNDYKTFTLVFLYQGIATFL